MINRGTPFPAGNGNKRELPILRSEVGTSGQGWQKRAAERWLAKEGTIKVNYS